MLKPADLELSMIRQVSLYRQINLTFELTLSIHILAKQEKSAPYGGALLVGGEEEALQRLKSFSIETSSLSTSKSSDGKKTGDSIYGANFSCKISPWLAMGCLSPRRMFEDLKKSTSR